MNSAPDQAHESPDAEPDRTPDQPRGSPTWLWICAHLVHGRVGLDAPHRVPLARARLAQESCPKVTEPLVPRPVHAVNTTPGLPVTESPTILYEIDTVFGPMGSVR